jgi:large subunit ribosomal protein L2
LFLKKFKPTTNGVRHKLNLSSYFLNSKKFNYFRVGFKKNSGRNITGRITVNHKINYTNKSYILLNFKRLILTLGVCINVIKDPNRSALIALIKFSNGSFNYMLSPHGFINGSFSQSIIQPELFSTNYKLGFNTFLRNLQPRSIFFNVEIYSNSGGIFARSAGTYCILINNDFIKNLSKIKLPSSKIITISTYCIVTLGRCSNIFKKNYVFGNAGYNVRKGFKPIVRGVAMNPVDHPHGGRTKTNSPEVTP